MIALANESEMNKKKGKEWAKNGRWGFWTLANKCSPMYIAFGCRLSVDAEEGQTRFILGDVLFVEKVNAFL